METNRRNLVALGSVTGEPLLAGLAVTLILGNLLDALFTMTFLQLHVVDETNPFMRWLYEGSPLSFMVTKLACVQIAFLLLWANRRLPAAQLAMAAGATMYTLVVAYHLSILAVLPSVLPS
jgi:hypothetical protein